MASLNGTGLSNWGVPPKMKSVSETSPVELKPVPSEWLDAVALIEINRLGCCGLMEISGISALSCTGDKALAAICTRRLFMTTGAIIFTDASVDDDYEDDDYDDEWEWDPGIDQFWPNYGIDLKRAIEKNNCGLVQESIPIFNYNSDHYIHQYLWIPNNYGILAFLKKDFPHLLPFFNGAKPPGYKY